MTTPLRYENSRLQRMEQASLWLQRMHDAGEDGSVVEAWLDWCQSDPLNQQAFDEIVAVWELGGHLSGAPRPGAASAAVRKPRRALLAAAAGLALAMVGAGWWLMRPQPAVLTSEFSSPTGVNSVNTLADGSVLELGGRTRVTVHIGPRERRVELHEGELYVTVHHEPGRPFTVAADVLEVIATGTAFNVRHSSERTTVTVTEGSVRARYDGRPVGLRGERLKVGRQLVLARESGSLQLRDADPLNAIAWRGGLLPFNGEPLSEAIAAINRYSARQSVIEDARIRTFAITATARTSDIGAWLRSLPEVVPVVTVVDMPDGRHLIRPISRRSD